jgi:hypothetical protein
METAERTQSAESGAPKPGRVGRPLPRVPDGQAQRSDAESGYSSSTRSKHPSQALLLTSPAPPLRSPPPAWAQMLGFGGFSLVGLTTPPHRLCSPSRRSARFWRPWVKAPGEKEEGTPHRAVEAVSEHCASEGCRGRSRMGMPGLKDPPGSAYSSLPLVYDRACQRVLWSEWATRIPPELGGWKAWGHISRGREGCWITQVSNFYKKVNDNWDSSPFFLSPDAQWPRNDRSIRKALPIQTPGKVSDRPHWRSPNSSSPERSWGHHTPAQ